MASLLNHGSPARDACEESYEKEFEMGILGNSVAHKLDSGVNELYSGILLPTCNEDSLKAAVASKLKLELKFENE